MPVETRQMPPTRTVMNITSATVLATVAANAAGAPAVTPPIQCVRIILNTPGGTATTINDCATTGAAAAANTVLTIPSTAVAGTSYPIDWPFFLGLVVVPGTSAVLSIAFNP